MITYIHIIYDICKRDPDFVRFSPWTNMTFSSRWRSWIQAVLSSLRMYLPSQPMRRHVVQWLVDVYYKYTHIYCDIHILLYIFIHVWESCMIIKYGCATSIMYILLLTICTVEGCTFFNNISNNPHRLYCFFNLSDVLLLCFFVVSCGILVP